MHVKIDATTTGGLKLVPDLQLPQLGRLEGYNGIGKSAAVRLLQVCTGEQPYPDSARLWSSFRAGMTRATVTVTGLREVDEIRWELDPSVWPARPSDPINRVGDITIDGRAGDVATVAKLLRVHRIVGTEGLVPALARQLAPKRHAINAAFADDGTILTRLTELDNLFHEVQQRVTAVSVENLEKATAGVRRAREAQRAARADLDLAKRTRTGVAEAVTVLVQRNDVATLSEDLDAEVADLANQIAAAEEQLAALDERIAEALAQAGAQSAVRRELTNAQRHAARTRIRVDDAAEVFTEAAHRSGLGTSSPENVDVDALSADFAQRLEAAQQQLLQVHAAPRLADLAESLADALRSAEGDGLGEQPLLNDSDGDAVYTIEGLRTALEERAAALRAAPVPEQATTLDDEIDATRRELAAVADLRAARKALLAAMDAEAKATARLGSALAAVGDSAGADSTKLAQSRQDLIAELRNLSVAHVDRVRAREALGGGMTEQDLTTRLAVLLGELGLSADELSGAGRDAEATVARAEGHHHDTTAAVRAAQNVHDGITKRLDTSVRLLREGPELGWLRRALGDQVPAADADPAWLLQFLADLDRQLEEVRTRIDGARQRARSVDGAINAVAEELLDSGRTADPSDGTAQVRRWFSRYVSTWFQQPQLLETLFPGGTDVHVDLADQSVLWREGEQRFTRPLNGFSSGELAFAYTRAQLALLDGAAPVANRVVALDEFGAFMARRWLHRLEEYLRQRIVDNPTDRVLLILPLTVSEEQLAASPDRAAELADITTRGYTVYDLSAL